MDFNDFETYLIVGAVLEAIILICFFVLCKNVGNIKDRLLYRDKPISDVVSVLIAAGQKEKARTVMIEYLTGRICSLPGIRPDKVDIENVIKQHKTILGILDLNFDVDSFINSRNSFYK